MFNTDLVSVKNNIPPPLQKKKKKFFFDKHIYTYINF